MSARVTVEFGATSQSRAALDAAAYRMIGTATCQIEQVGNKWLCHITETGKQSSQAEDLQAKFLNLVTDENLRERVAEKTTGVRNVLLALAFGSLASGPEKKTE